MDKKRILLCNEASYLATGFSTYGLEVMKRLYSTGKYELAEFATYGGTEFNNETRYRQLPWKFYPNMPQNQEEAKLYNPNTIDQFGAWKFERTVLDFKPDIVWDIRDWWMMEHQDRSVFRKYFKWVIMPTVDAFPQDDQWISTFLNADGVFAYSDWGLKVLTTQAPAMKALGTASPGIDLDSFFVPNNKKEHKQKMGLDKDVFIVGTVMRNQERKLYPDLILAFADFLKNAPIELSRKTYLYLHCAYPDIGWDIPRLIKEAGIANRTIFTYSCKNCGAVFPSFYQDVIGICRSCGQPTARMPKTQTGVDRKVLANIIGLFDAYVQYSTCEGFGMPQIEAAACGVPVFAVDYSAMSDVVRKVEGFPVKIKTLFREQETHCYRALPDNDDFVQKLISFFQLPEQIREEIGKKARQAVERHYSWDRTARAWETCFDRIPILTREQTWFSPANFHRPVTEIPEGLSNEELVRWGIVNIAGRPDLTNSYMALRMVRDLNWGIYQDGMGGRYQNEASSLGVRSNHKEFSRKDVIGILLQMSNDRNLWEEQRLLTLGEQNEVSSGIFG